MPVQKTLDIERTHDVGCFTDRMKIIIFFIRKLFQSIRLYIKGMLNGQPATHRLAET